MKLEQRSRDGIAILIPDGELRGDPAESELLRTTVKQLVTAGTTNAVLNLSHVKWVNSSGLGQILAMFEILARNGGRMKMAEPNPRIAKILETTRFDRVIPTFASESEAVSSFREAQD